MTATLEIGYDKRCWVTFEIKDATPEEVEALENGDEDSISLAAEMYRAGRLTEIDDHEEDNADYFDTEQSSVIEVNPDAEAAA